MKKFNIQDSANATTPMATTIGDSVDMTTYRGVIGSLLYLNASRPDIICNLSMCKISG